MLFVATPPPESKKNLKVLAKTPDSTEGAVFLGAEIIQNIRKDLADMKTTSGDDDETVYDTDYIEDDEDEEIQPPPKRKRATKSVESESAVTAPGLPRRVVSASHQEWFPNILDNGRLTAFIPGNPGAGKSYLAAELIKSLPSDYDILLFTAIEENDGNFKEFGKRVHKIKMDPENLSRMSLSNIRKVSKHPILLFDDIDKIRNREVERWTYKILEDALANGRGHENHDGNGDIHIIVTSHALNDYRKTKYTLENSDYTAVFPGSTTQQQMALYFKKLGISPEVCQEVYEAGRECKVRRVIIHKVFPMYIIIGDTLSLL